MNLFNLFKLKKSTSTARVLEAGATFYAGRILIETVDRVKEGFGISSSKVSVLPIDASSELVGSTLRYHLSLTQHDLDIPKDYKKHYKEFLSAAGLKTAKEHYKDALYLIVYDINGLITIQPTVNGGASGKDRGFNEIEGKELKVRSDVSNQILGETVRSAWAVCECQGQGM